MKTLLTIAVIATSIILVISLIIGVVAMAFGGVFDDIAGWFDKDGGSSVGSGGGGGGNRPSKDNGDDKTIVSASLSLPSATPSGTYLGSNSASEITGIDSKAAILIDASNGQMVAGLQADEKIYPASMTKVMTVLVACEQAENAGKLLTIEQWMIDYANDHGASSSSITLVAGDQISLENALYLINYNSCTISCLLVAKYIAGSEAKFVERMNERARQLGLTKTNFVNTTGLHDANHYTTCREMAAIMNAAMNNTAAKKIISSYAGRPIAIYRNNELDHTSSEIYSGWYSVRFGDNNKISSEITAIAGKTGYEDIPTACFVTAAKHKNGKTYICVTVGCINDSDADVSTAQSTTDTKTIYKNYAKG